MGQLFTMKLAVCIALVVLVATTAATARLKIDRDELARIDAAADAPREVVRRVTFKCAMVRAHINCTVDPDVTGVLD